MYDYCRKDRWPTKEKIKKIMITFKIDLKEEIKEIIIEGHANNGKESHAALCAAVSMAALMTANTIKHLDLDHFVIIETRDGYFEIKSVISDKTVQDILKNLQYTMEDLIKQYPRYIRKDIIKEYPF